MSSACHSQASCLCYEFSEADALVNLRQCLRTMAGTFAGWVDNLYGADDYRSRHGCLSELNRKIGGKELSTGKYEEIGPLKLIP
jgi:hypothetical protein